MACTRVPVELDSVIPDRIGGPGGSCQGGTATCSTRGQSPDGLNFVRTSFDIDLDRARQVGIRAGQTAASTPSAPAMARSASSRPTGTEGSRRTRRRSCGRPIATARSSPISRVRSITDNASVWTP